ncbi:hypothetical protein KSX_44330 [Ktedonospora formicarum]|uniref:Uncharacterized protein n=1 Tax=Ktedonospora formicarum TaxID=2778364 RepID=A0A8J3MSM3_9CHLR|nr:hypothetical protein KSX_44330 [Ktedonospora formicarum]
MPTPIPIAMKLATTILRATLLLTSLGMDAVFSMNIGTTAKIPSIMTSMLKMWEAVP